MQKLAIITGGNTGLGFECAKRALAEQYRVVIACRSIDKGEQAKKTLNLLFPKSEVSVQQLDLADLQSVKVFCENFDSHWNLLLNNAGAKIELPYKQTKQGFEWHIGVNHLGHFALTCGLITKAAQAATVSTVTSVVSSRGSLDLSDINPNGAFNERQAYANSKLMNLAFAIELANRFEGSQMRSTASHPGFARASAYGSKAIRISEYLLAQSARLGSDSIWQSTKATNGALVAPKYFELWGQGKELKTRHFEPNELDTFWMASEALTGFSY